jgi:maltose alpha-D-glucosyltransferase/alpha-amylase
MWDTLLESHYLFALCHDILPPYLARQRWFGGKAKDLTSCCVIDWCKLGASFYIVFLRLQYASGEQEDYVVPMKIVQGQTARILAEEIPDSVLAFVNNRRGDGILYDALMDRVSYDILFAAIGDGRQYTTAKGGTIKALPTKIYDELVSAGSCYTSVRKLGVEQSNTSIIIGEAFVLKLYRRLEKGLNPDVEMSLYLTEKNQFTSIARVVGTLQYQDASGGEATMGMLQEFVSNQGDGWSYSLAALQNYYEEAEKRLVEGEPAPTMELPLMETLQGDPPAAFVAMTDEYLQSIRTLGRRTAEFHLALSEEKKNPAFKPEKSTAVFTEQLAESVIRQIQEPLAMLSAKLNELPAEVRKNGDRVLRDVPILLDRVSEMTDKGEKLGYLIRHHGDYHLGQILRTDEDDFILLDFEGEPLRPLAERRRKGSPLKDLAGMMRSFHYAAETALPEKSGQSGRYENLIPWSRAWHEWMSSVFLRSYFQTAAGAPFLPTVDAGFILEVFLLEKVFYELKYELNNRPDWVHIPLAGIVDIIDTKRLSTR